MVQKLSLTQCMKQRLTVQDYMFFAEAWLSLARARWMLLFRPFNKIMPLIKNDREFTNEAGIELLGLIQLSIARASVRSPWRTKCFEQALAARMMLMRRGIAATIYFGVLKKPDNKMEAHAWLKCRDIVVTGWKKMDSYTVVAQFP